MNSNDAQRLYAALDTFRREAGPDRGPSLVGARERAARDLEEVLPRAIAGAVRSFPPEAREAAEHAVRVKSAIRGCFAGTTPGEAVAFVRRVALRTCLDWVKHHQNRPAPLQRRAEPAQDAETPAGSLFGADDALSPEEAAGLAERQRILSVAIAKLLLLAGRKGERIRVFVFTEAQGSEGPLPGDVLKSRSVGRQYARQVLEEGKRRRQFTDAEILALEGLLS